jgi:DNA-binding transcriptional ArsR family regulator
MPRRPLARVHGPRVLEIAVSTKNGLEAQPASESGRLRVLELLRSAPGGLGVTDLAMQLGLHTNTVRFHLNRLVAAGLATREVEQHNGPGRPRLTFAAAPKAWSWAEHGAGTWPQSLPLRNGSPRRRP